MATTPSGFTHILAVCSGETGTVSSGSPRTGADGALATVSGLLAEQGEVKSGFDLVEACLEVTSIPGWTPPLTLQVLDASELAPKEEAVIYKQHAQIFRWRDGEWKERGTGDAMLLRHRETGSVRFFMWQDSTYKTIANCHIIESSLHCHLQIHEGDLKTWEWRCQDYSDDRLGDEKFALHFKTEELAVEFRKVFDGAKVDFNSDGDGPVAAAEHGDSFNALSTSIAAVEWKCTDCLLLVSSDKLICPCCEHQRLQKPEVELTNAVGSVNVVPASESVLENSDGCCTITGGAVAATTGSLDGDSSANISVAREEQDASLVQQVSALQL